MPTHDATAYEYYLRGTQQAIDYLTQELQERTKAIEPGVAQEEGE